MPGKPSKRKPKNPDPMRRGGRPASDEERPIKPEDLPELTEMWLTGHTLTEMAARYGCHLSTVAHHIAKKVKPALRAEIADRLAVEVAKVDALERVAWRCFRLSQQPETRRAVKRALLDGGADPTITEVVTSEITRTGNVGYLQIVQWCRDWFARVGGWYQSRDEGKAASKTEVLPVVLVRINTREEAKQAMSWQEVRERTARDLDN